MTAIVVAPFVPDRRCYWRRGPVTMTAIGSYRFVDEITDQITDAIEAMRTGLDVSPLITHTFGLDRAAAAMAVALYPGSGSSKVMLRIGWRIG